MYCFHEWSTECHDFPYFKIWCRFCHHVHYLTSSCWEKDHPHKKSFDHKKSFGNNIFRKYCHHVNKTAKVANHITYNNEIIMWCHFLQMLHCFPRKCSAAFFSKEKLNGSFSVQLIFNAFSQITVRQKGKRKIRQ